MPLLDQRMTVAPADPYHKHSQSEITRLVGLLRDYAPTDGRFAMPIPGTYAIRASQRTKELTHSVQNPAVYIVAQGAKAVFLGSEIYEYTVERMLISSVDLPVTSQVIQASPEKPFLCFRLDLEPARIAELALNVFPSGVPYSPEKRAVYIAPTTAQMMNTVTRLVELTKQPGDAELIAPLVIDELLIRLLRSPIGARVAQIGLAESGVHRIAQAIQWVRANFSQPMHVKELADMVHMSVSSFHQHFKAVTAMSPLHYQKVLRLQEARRLMILLTLDPGTASQRVGYVSASQFSRDYRHFFGLSPTRDIARLREQGRHDSAHSDS